MTIGRDRREDFSLMDCPERLNGPHCPHQLTEHVHSASMQCCWCGAQWTEPRAQAFDRHGTYVPRSASSPDEPRTREGRS